jgi:autotransporter-associated beta strand protein
MLEALEDRWLPSTFQWTGAGASNLWSDASNWKNLALLGQAPGVPNTGDSLRFVAGAARLVNTDDLPGRTFASLEISGSGYTLQSAPGVALQVGAGGITADNSSGSNSISATINLPSAQLINVTNPATFLAFTGLLTGASGGIFKAGAGLMIITSNNDYGGLTTVSAGELDVNASRALGQATVGGETDVSPGATLSIDPGASGGAEQLRLNGLGVNSQGALVLSDCTWTGPVILASDTRIGVSSTLNATLTGAISGPGDLIKVGTSKLILAGTSTNTYTGDTLITNGALDIQKASALGTSTSGVTMTTVSSGAGLEIEGAFSVIGELLNLAGTGRGGGGAVHIISGDSTWSGPVSLSGNVSIAVDDSASLTVQGIIGGTGGFTKVGAGRLILNGANTYLGTTMVSQGVVRVGNNSALGGQLLGLPEAGTVVLTGAALEVGRAATTISVDEPLTINGTGIASTGALRSLFNTNTWTGAITLGSSSFIGVDGDNLNLAGATSGDATRSLTKVGIATLILTVDNPNLLGEIFVLQGGIEVESSAALGDPASPTNVLGGNCFLRLLNNVVVSESLNLAGQLNGEQVKGAGVTYAGTITLVGDAAINGELGGMTVTGKITGTGNLGYDEDVILAGGTVNDYVGNTFIGTILGLHLRKPTGVIAIPTGLVEIDDDSTVVYDNILGITGSGQISPAADVIIDIGGLLDLNGRSNTIRSLTLNGGIADSGTGTLTVTGSITGSEQGTIHGNLSLGNVSHTITAAGPPDGFPDLIIDARIHSTGSGGGIVKAGSGDLQLSGTNDYSGATQINSGIVLITSATALGQATTAGSTTVADGAALEVFGPVSSAEPLILTGAGIANVNGTGPSGALLMADVHGSSNNAVLSGQITLAGDATVRVDATDSLELDGQITGRGNLTKTAGGTLIMGGNTDNNYQGTTTVAAGNLLLDKTNSRAINRGALIIGDNIHAATVVLDGDNQTLVDVAVMTGGAFILNNHVDDVGNLDLTGGSVLIGSGVLFLHGYTIAHPSSEESLISDGFLVLLSESCFFDVEDGPGLTDLVVSAGIVKGAPGNIGLLKEGPGTLLLLGTNGNTFDFAQVNEGMVELAKSGGALAISSNLTVGDGLHHATVQWLGDDQIDDGGLIVVNSPFSSLNLNGHAETVSALQVNGGAVAVGTGTLKILARIDMTACSISTVGTGKVILDGGTLVSHAAATPAAISGQFELDGTSDTITIEDGLAGQDLIIEAALIGGPAIKDGPGTLTVTGNDTSPFVLDAGTLLMNGTSLGDVTVQGGSLGGTGTVPNIVASGGTVDPGRFVGILTASQNVTLNALSTFEVDLDRSTTPGIDFDQLAVNGTVTLNNAALVIDPGAPAFGVPLDVIHAGGALRGVFIDPSTGAVLANGATIVARTGQQFVITYGPQDVFLTPQDTAPKFANRSVTSPINEGGVTTLAGTITEPDPRDSFTLVVNWGDSSPVQTLTFPAGSNGQMVQVSHVYKHDGRYTVHASWHDPLGLGNSADLQVEVNNVAPTVDAGGDEHLSKGRVLKRVGSFSDPGADTWTATVDYGDGSGPHKLKLGPDKKFHLHHKFRDAGTYRVTVTVLDDDGGVGTASFRVIVA